MKKLLTALLLLVGFASYAQNSWYSPYSNTFETYTQLWNLSNVYYNGVTSANLGNQLDTATDATALYLTTAQWGTGTVNSDTFRVAPINGSGTIHFEITSLKCTGTPTVTVTIEESSNGVSGWSTVAGTSALTFNPSSLTVSTSQAYDLSVKYCKYYRVKVLGTGTQTTSWQARAYFRPSFTYYKNP